MVLSIKSVLYGAHVAPPHEGASSVDVDARKGDVVLRDGLTGASRFRFDSVTYHPFHATLYESVLARRVAENFGGGCPYACDAPPYSMHAAIIHGSPRRHSEELFHAVVLLTVGHALDVLAETSVGHVQLHYSMARVYSWGVTDVLNQQVVANRPVGIYTHAGNKRCRPQLQHNVVSSRNDAGLATLLKQACAVPEGHSCIVFSLFAKVAGMSASGVFTIALLPQLSQGNLVFQVDMHVLRDLISGHPAPHDKPCWLLHHLMPSREVRSLAMITCIAGDHTLHQENYHNCVYGSRSLGESVGDVADCHLCQGSNTLWGCIGLFPSRQPVQFDGTRRFCSPLETL
ncbi:hypothetical protein TraAM80_05462, partial [Trypanosoma rangeli]